MKRLVIDLDGTLTLDQPGIPYEDKLPNVALLTRLHQYREEGYVIIVATARNMRTYNGSVGHINANTLPIVLDWLKKHDVPFDEIHVGKPWCGDDGFYVDDRAIRPSEFIAMTKSEIRELLANEGLVASQPISLSR